MSLSIKAELNADVNELARATTLNVLKGVVLATPRDTGRAKGNWQVSISGPINTQTELLDLTGRLAINKGLVKILAAKTVKNPVFWVTNNLPYIEGLNAGTSTQAPAKFVETVIKQVTNG